MLKHIIQKCVIIVLAVGYILGVSCLQGFEGEVLVDLLTILVLGLWAYILLDDFDFKVLSEHRVVTPKHIAYEACFFLSLASITAAYLVNTFAWGLTTLIMGIVAFIAGCVLYAECFRHEDEYISAEIDNCHHLIWVLTSLRKKTEEWTEERIVDYATKKFRFYPKGMRLERGLDVLHTVDGKGTFRTLAEMKEADPGTPEVLVAEENIKKMARDFVARREEKALKKAQKAARKAQKKEAK